MKTIRSHINPTTILALLALVFAVTGGAYAATGHGDSPTRGRSDGSRYRAWQATARLAKKKKSSPVGKPGPRGPAGPAGAAGPAGPAGPSGPAGSAGARGENGANGTNGSNGENGKSVALGSPGTHCPAGGTSVEVSGAGSPQYVCNGKNGPAGPEGVCAKEHCTLPEGTTETGAWSVGPLNESDATPGSPYLVQPIASFAIPLAAPLASGTSCEEVENGRVKPACKVHYIDKEGKEIVETASALEELPSAACPGSVEKPAAASGNFCVYAREEIGTETGFAASGDIRNPGGSESESSAGTMGAFMLFVVPGATKRWAYGTWAVTG